MLSARSLKQLLQCEVDGAERFVDLFSGSGAVSIHVAETYPIPVLSVDLQAYSAVLAEAVISRTSAFEWESSPSESVTLAKGYLDPGLSSTTGVEPSWVTGVIWFGIGLVGLGFLWDQQARHSGGACPI